MNVVEPYLRRKKRDEGDPYLLLKLSIMFFIGAVCYVAYVFTPTVKAEDTIRASEAHDVRSICQFAKEHPGAIINLGNRCHE